MQPWKRFVAIGDSYTEGLMDELGADGRHRGWADRVAESLAREYGGIEYANLAVRGRLIAQVVEEQVPAAVALQPDLVSLAAGVNDVIRRSFDLNVAATQLERGVRVLRASGADVLLQAWGNPARRSKVMGAVAERIWELNRATFAIADEYDCVVVEFWDRAVFDDDALWDEDRLHLTPLGHTVAAAAAWSALTGAGNEWHTPFPPADPAPLHARIRGHASWATKHFAPWAVRRLRGVSSGEGITPKHPSYVHVDESGVIHNVG